MYKGIPTDVIKMELKPELFRYHKSGRGSDFGMDNTLELLEGGFGLYSTANIKPRIGPVKAQYFRVALVRGGSATVDLGLERYHPGRNSVILGFPGQIFSLYDMHDFHTYYMLFTEQFITGALLHTDKGQPYPFLTYEGLQSFILDDDTAAEVEDLIFRMDREIKARQQGCALSIRLYIQLIFILVNRAYNAEVSAPAYPAGSAQHLFTSYLKLVSRHFLEMRKVADYAGMLHVSPDHLNRAVKSCSDSTAHHFIEEMLLRETKAYLLQSGLSISEIAYKLDFADPSHFNRFFRKLSGQTPSDFRKESEAYQSKSD